jgi:peptide chain release factor subunit 3
MAYIMDTNEEERTKGITVEVGRAHFETEKKRYTILDAPGHKNYVPNMIQGACQADVAILLISARKGEFETGFERGGQTREHAQLAKTLGVSRLIVVINKLDCPSVCLPGGKWDKGRFDSIVSGMTPFLRSCGYNLKKEVVFLPVAALYGHNIKERVPPELCDWCDTGSMFEVLDAIEPMERNPLASVRLPIVDRWKEMGTIVMGKLESGFMRIGDVFQIMPNKLKVKVEAIYRDEKEVTASQSGENLRLRLTGAEETDISSGFVLSSIRNPVPCVTMFEAQLMIVELLEHNPVFTVGYKSVLHIHTACEECEVIKLISEVDPKTKEQKKARFVKQGGICMCRISVEKAICIEAFQDIAALGRFTLRDEGRTIAIGKIMKLPKVH